MRILIINNLVSHCARSRLSHPRMGFISAKQTNGAARIRLLWMEMASTRPNIHLVDLELTKYKYGHHQMALAKSQTVNNKCMFTY